MPLIKNNSVFITFMRYLVNSGFIIFTQTIAKITTLEQHTYFFVLNKQIKALKIGGGRGLRKKDLGEENSKRV